MTTTAYADFSIKARCSSLEELEQKLISLGPVYLGEDFQTDTYFAVPNGRLKLRKGNIEHLLTHYLREEEEGGKMKTTVFLYEENPSSELIQFYTASLKRIGQVVKRRKIYVIDNVKFHLDELSDGRTFVELEAIDRKGLLGLDQIRKQAEEYKKALAIKEEDVLKSSYIDMRE